MTPAITRSTRRCGATRPTTCPASPAWGRRRRPSSSTRLRRARRGSSPTSTSCTPKLRENLAATRRRAQEPAVDGPRARRRRSTLERRRPRMGQSAIDVDERAPLFDFLEFRTLCDRLARGRSTTDLGAVRPTPWCWSAEVDVPSPTRPRRRRLARRGLAGDERPAGRSPPPGRAPRGARRSRAWPSSATATPVTSSGSGRAARRRGRARRARRRWSPDGRPVDAHQAKPLMRALTSLGVDVRGLALDTAIAAYLIDPAGAATSSRTWCCGTSASRSQPRRRTRRRGPARPRRTATPTSTAHGRRPALLAVDRARRAAAAPPSTRRGSAPLRRHRAPARPVSWPGWRRPASRST